MRIKSLLPAMLSIAAMSAGDFKMPPNFLPRGIRFRYRTNTHCKKTPETPADFAAIEAANAKIERRRIARELNKARSMKGAQ